MSPNNDQTVSFQDRLDWAAGHDTEDDDPHIPGTLYLFGGISSKELEQAFKEAMREHDGWRKYPFSPLVLARDPGGIIIDEIKPVTKEQWDYLLKWVEDRNETLD